MVTLGIFIFAGHLAVVRWSMREPSSPPGLSAVAPAGRWVEGGISELGIAAIHPQIFGLDRDSGFSLAAGQLLPRTEYESQERKLAMPPGLAATVSKLGQSARVPLFKRGIQEPAVALLDQPSAARTPSLSIPMIEAYEGLHSRGWKQIPVLTPWAGAEVPGPVLLQVAINSGGYIVLASVRESSGLPDADQLALAAVRKGRFQPEATLATSPATSVDNLVWGWLRVRWSISSPLPLTR